MTQKKVIAAYKALESLSKQALPIKEAYALHKLRAKLKSAWDFQIEQENKLVERLKPKADSGKLFFQTTEDALTWQDEMTAISSMENDIEFTPVNIGMTDDLRISPDDIEALDGFVVFNEA